MKKIIALILFVGLPIMIYLLTIDNKVYYLALGDSLAAGQNPYGKISYGYTDYVADYLKSKNKLSFYTKNFTSIDYRTTDLINDITQNKNIVVDNKKITIKYALTKADVVTISIGTNDMLYKLGINDIDLVYYNTDNLNRYVDEIILDVEKLIVLVRRYCKEDIVLVGYYNPLWHMRKLYAKDLDSVFLYANEKMINLSQKYNLYYVDIYQEFRTKSGFFPNPLDIHPSNEGYSAISKRIIKIINDKVLD